MLKRNLSVPFGSLELASLLCSSTVRFGLYRSFSTGSGIYYNMGKETPPMSSSVQPLFVSFFQPMEQASCSMSVSRQPSALHSVPPGFRSLFQQPQVRIFLARERVLVHSARAQAGFISLGCFDRPCSSSCDIYQTFLTNSCRPYSFESIFIHKLSKLSSPGQCPGEDSLPSGSSI